MKLQSMTEFVLEQGRPHNTDSQFADKTMAYAHFLKQDLTIGMFVPCDEDGSVLQEPSKPNLNSLASDWINEQYNTKLVKYQQAKEKVLFEGFDLDEYRNVYYMGQEILHESELKHFYIEFLINEVAGEITLTKSAIKQIGLNEN